MLGATHDWQLRLTAGNSRFPAHPPPHPPMRIGIIGSGMIGGTAARVFTRAGHEVAISNSRGPESLRDLVAELGPRAHAATVDEAARFGEVVLLAVPFRAP